MSIPLYYTFFCPSILGRRQQISRELFLNLIRYHFAEMYELEKDIKSELEKKLNLMVMREYYTTYKTAPTEQEREKSRKKYLNERGVPESFRW